jgi:metal transporter CNNM
MTLFIDSYAAVILPLRQKGHWLLTTIILMNVILNESLPIMVDHLVGVRWKAVVISTVLVLLFGELIPDGKSKSRLNTLAICNRHALAIGAHSAFFVKGLMYLLFPIVYPLAMILDWALGKEEPLSVGIEKSIDITYGAIFRSRG